ncbi:hypothetical protein CRG98_027142, partial [Punica granatum]
MERLLSSSSSSLLPSRVLRKPHSPFPSRLGRADSPTLAPSRTEPRRVGPVSCSHKQPPPPKNPKSLEKPPPLWTRRVDSPPESVSTSQFPKHNAAGGSRQRKAIFSGTCVLLSALVVAIIHPLFASPAFATFQNAAKTGPDHLAALAPLSIGRTKMESAAVGALWGCGHDAGQVIFGLLFLLLKDRLHIEVIRTWGTR